MVAIVIILSAIILLIGTKSIADTGEDAVDRESCKASVLFKERSKLLGKPLILEGGGKSKLDFTYVKDTAKGFVLATFSPNAEQIRTTQNRDFSADRRSGSGIPHTQRYAAISG